MVLLLVRFNMVTLEKLRQFRGYFIVVAFVIAAIVTPPDVISQLSLAIPMCLLYEVGLWAARWIKRKDEPGVDTPSEGDTAKDESSDDAK